MTQTVARRIFQTSKAPLACLLITGSIFITGCGDSKASDSVRARADSELKNFVAKKFETLKGEDFIYQSEKKNADDSWEFIYESRATETLPRFRLFVTVTADGNTLFRAQKENDPTKAPVGAEALKAQRR